MIGTVSLIPTEDFKLMVEINYPFDRMKNQLAHLNSQIQEYEQELKEIQLKPSTVLDKANYLLKASKQAREERDRLKAEVRRRCVNDDEEMTASLADVDAGYKDLKRKYKSKASTRYLHDKEAAFDTANEQRAVEYDLKDLKEVKSKAEAITALTSGLNMAMETMATRVLSYVNDRANQRLTKQFQSGVVKSPRYKTLVSDNPLVKRHFPGMLWGLNQQYKVGNFTAMKDDFITFIKDLPVELSGIEDMGEFKNRLVLFRELLHSKDYQHFLTIDVMLSIMAFAMNMHGRLREKGLEKFNTVFEGLFDLHPGDDEETKLAIRDGLNSTLFDDVLKAMTDMSKVVLNTKKTTTAWGPSTSAGRGGDRQGPRGTPMRGRGIEAHHVKFSEHESYAAAVPGDTKFVPKAKAPSSIVWYKHPGRLYFMASVKDSTFAAPVAMTQGVWIRRQVLRVEDNTTFTEEYPYLATESKCVDCANGSDRRHNPKCFLNKCNLCGLWGHQQKNCLQKA
jgi:F0F1-type ATP synthase membrane subunit b/b'